MEIQVEPPGLGEAHTAAHPEVLRIRDLMAIAPQDTGVRVAVLQAIEALEAVLQGTGVRVAVLQVTEVPEVGLQVPGVPDLAGVPVAAPEALALAGAQEAVPEVRACGVQEGLPDLPEEAEAAAEGAAEEDSNHPNYIKSIITKR